MIDLKLGQMKSGIIMTFTDSEDSDWVRTVRLNWREAAGLRYSLTDALDNPQWTERDPKSQKKEVRYGKQPQEVD